MPLTRLPATGSRWRWHNPKSTRVYIIIDVFVADGSLEVRYRSDDMQDGQYCQQSLASFYSLTKQGKPRFTPLL